MGSLRAFFQFLCRKWYETCETSPGLIRIENSVKFLSAIFFRLFRNGMAGIYRVPIDRGSSEESASFVK